MKTRIKLSESDLIRIVKKTIEEQTKFQGTFEGQGKTPTDDPLFKNFINDVEGDGVTGKKIDANTLQFNCNWGPVYQLKKIK